LLSKTHGVAPETISAAISVTVPGFAAWTYEPLPLGMHALSHFPCIKRGLDMVPRRILGAHTRRYRSRCGLQVAQRTHVAPREKEDAQPHTILTGDGFPAPRCSGRRRDRTNALAPPMIDLVHTFPFEITIGVKRRGDGEATAQQHAINGSTRWSLGSVARSQVSSSIHVRNSSVGSHLPNANATRTQGREMGSQGPPHWREGATQARGPPANRQASQRASRAGQADERERAHTCRGGAGLGRGTAAFCPRPCPGTNAGAVSCTGARPGWSTHNQCARPCHLSREQQQPVCAHVGQGAFGSTMRGRRPPATMTRASPT